MVEYNLIEHTADLGVRIKARDYNELFVSAPKILYELIGEIVVLENEVKEEKIILKANDWETLLHDWLSEALYWFDVRERVFEDIRFEILKETYLEARITPKKLDLEKTVIRTEIKAITYHNLKIVQTTEGIETTIIFDI